jgi:hypothetical protein
MVDRAGWRLSNAERRAWRDDGFFARGGRCSTRASSPAVRRGRALRLRARAAMQSSARDYAIDGNVYHEAGGSTIQLEHAPGSQDDPRDRARSTTSTSAWTGCSTICGIVEPMRDLVGDERVALFTDKLNLKRPREGSRFRWHQDSPYWAHFFRELDRLPNVLLNPRRRRRAERVLPRDPRQPSPRHAARLRRGGAARARCSPISAPFRRG